MAKLFIIGNGFDLHHGMKTSYKDYKHYLNKTNRKTTSIIFEMYPLLNNINNRTDNDEMIDLLWSDVEGNSTFDYELWADSIDSSLDEYSKGSKSLQAQSDIKKAKKFYRDIFKEWVNTISLGDKKTDIEELILPEDYFITFNYTLTLEELYNIPSNHILHIHGKIDDNNELEFGSFANDPKKVLNELNNKYFDRIDKDEDLVKMISNLSKVVKNMSKGFNKNLKKLKDFVNNIEDKLSEVVIYGLCIKPKFMDEPYFKKFLFDYFKDIKWTCYYFNEKEQINQWVYFKLNNLDKKLTQLPMNDFNYDGK